jgi:replication factor C subunit 2/4
MTPWAQTALRRIIENHVRSTRFILICNYVSRIIDPLVSRCAKFRFKALPQQSMQNRLMEISKLENVRWMPAVGTRIAQVAAGDMRRAVTLLQTVCAFHMDNMSGSEEESAGDPAVEQAVVQAVDDVAGIVPDGAIQALIDTATTGVFAPLQTSVMETTMSGFAGNLVLSQLFDALVADGSPSVDSEDLEDADSEIVPSDVRAPEALGDTQRARIALSLAEADAALVDGADETLQLLNALADWSGRI